MSWGWPRASTFAFHCVGDGLMGSGVTEADVATEIIGCKAPCASGTETQRFDFSVSHLLGG